MSLNILLFGARRRVFFIEKLRAYLRESNIEHKLFYCDTDHFDPARFHVDEYLNLPNSHTPGFEIPLLEAVSKFKINFIIPWLDADILAFVNSRDELRKLGAELALPSNHIVRLFNDKFETAKWMENTGLPQPKTVLIYKDSPLSVEDIETLGYPIFAKPRFGQGSMGIKKLDSRKDLQIWMSNLDTDYVMQEFVSGEEFTVEICQKGHTPIFISPRKRLKTRGGESLISKIESHPQMIDLAKSIVEKIEIGGVYNFQVFLLKSGELKIIEFNPRFGGGSDLTIQAGGNIPQALLSLHLGMGDIKLQSITDRMVMTRYHSSEFFIDDK